jgi:hypothetical protein
MLRLMMLLLAGMLALPQQGKAQTRDHLLSGATKIQLEIGKLGDDSRRCGLTEEALRSTVMYPLSSSKIEVVPQGEVILYIDVNTLHPKLGLICSSSATIKAFSFQEATLAFSGEKKIVPVMLWEDGCIALSSPGDHAKYLFPSIEGNVKKFITDWNLDNKPVVTRR